jgi:hypothetical protein
MTVQEPNDIDKSTIDQHGVENFAAIVYEKSPTNPGLKQLGLADLKAVFDYNSRKADNVARLCGFPKDAEADPDCYDYKDGDVRIPTEGTLASQIQAVAANAGVGVTQSSPLNPLGPRLEKVETNLGTLEATPAKTLMERMHEAENDILDLAAEIGGGGGSAGTPLTNRVENLEAAVNGSGGNPGLSADVSDLKTTVGDSTSGLVKDVSQLQTEVEDGTTGLLTRMTDLENEIGDSTTPSAGTLNYKVAQNTSDINELKQTAAAAYKFQGSVNQANVDAKVVSQAVAGRLKGGEVWDCLTAVNFWFPEQGQPDEREYKYDQGVNFAFVKGETSSDPGRFDELGASFDTSDITNRLTALENKFSTNGTSTVTNWDSSSLSKGTYLISGYLKLGTADAAFAFIAVLGETGDLSVDTPIDLSGNFSTIFELDSQGVIHAKSNYSTFKQLNTLKLS